MKLADAFAQAIVAGAPLFFVLLVIFLVFAWIRLLVDSMSGRGL